METQVNRSEREKENIVKIVVKLEKILGLTSLEDYEVVTRLYVIAMKLDESKGLLKESLIKLGG